MATKRNLKYLICNTGTHMKYRDSFLIRSVSYFWHELRQYLSIIVVVLSVCILDKDKYTDYSVWNVLLKSSPHHENSCLSHIYTTNVIFTDRMSSKMVFLSILTKLLSLHPSHLELPPQPSSSPAPAPSIRWWWWGWWHTGAGRWRWGLQREECRQVWSPVGSA